MLTFLSILATLWSFLKPLYSSPLFWLVVISLSIGFHYGKAGCRRPSPPHVVTDSFEVISVPSGNTIEARAGLAGRRTRLITLADIACPVDGTLAEAARANLALSCGAAGRVEHERHGIFRAEAEAETESSAPLIGVVYGASGINCNKDQIEQGFGRCIEGAPADWIAAEKEAKKLKRGIWGEKTESTKYKQNDPVWVSYFSKPDDWHPAVVRQVYKNPTLIEIECIDGFPICAVTEEFIKPRNENEEGR